MMAYDMRDRPPLDIAIDHRIIALFKPVKCKSRHPSNPSKHVSRIKELGESLGRRPEEVQVTSELAGSADKGGIAITLQQPRSNHPFGQGIDSVIDDCKTLKALQEIFPLVSCKTLHVGAEICIVDLLPYMSDHIDKVLIPELRATFDHCVQMLHEKEPDVVLCAGKIWLPGQRFGRGSVIKGQATKLENIGVGRRFEEDAVETDIQGRDGSRITYKRVNGFHPSYAMNYHPHISLFRQLLILACAEACALLRGDWEDEGWMEALRSECERLSSDLSDEPLKRYIPDYRWPYRDILISIQSATIHLLCNLLLADNPTEVSYNDLLSSKLSILCNDASLILGKMHTLCEQGWPKKFDDENQSVLNESAVVTYNVIQCLLDSVGVMHASRFSDILQHGIDSITACLEIDQCSRKARKFILKQASRAFLEMAINIEAQLSNLMLDGEVSRQSSEPEDVLLAMIGNLLVTD